MMDIKLIRENSEGVRENIERRQDNEKINLINSLEDLSFCYRQMLPCLKSWRKF